MSYEISQQTLEESRFLYLEKTIPHEAIGETLGELLPAAFTQALQRGLAPVSPPMALYKDWQESSVTLRAGMLVAGAEAGCLDADVGAYVEVLPACEALTTVHTGPYDALGDAHKALESHLGESGFAVGGPSREMYLTDPGEVPDPSQWQTQVVLPLA